MKLSTMTCIMCKVVKWPIIPLGILIPIVLLLLLSCSVVSDSVQPHRWQPTRLPVPGFLQARTLEWVAISLSNAWKWKVKVKSLSPIWLLVTPWTAAHQTLLSMGFSRQEYWSGVPFPSSIPIVQVTKLISRIIKVLIMWRSWSCNPCLLIKYF